MKNKHQWIVAAIMIVIAISLKSAHASNVDNLWLDVSDFGASVYAPADSNARAIQRAIDSLKFGMTLVFPAPGVTAAYKVDRKLIMDSKDYVTIKGFSSGLGQGGTKIAWDRDTVDTANTILFEITNSKFCNIENIAFHGNASCDPDSLLRTHMGLYIHGKQPDTNNCSTSNIRFNDCAFYYFNVAIQIGDTATAEDNNENCAFTGCEMSYNGIGFRQYWANAMRNDFYALMTLFNDHDFVFANSSQGTGPNSIVGWATTGKAGSASIVLNNSVGLSIANIRTEGTGKFIDYPPVASSPVAEYITINNGEFHIVDTLPFIEVGAHLTAMNCSFGSFSEPAIIFAPPASSSAEWTFIGCHFNNAKLFDSTDNWLQGSTVKLTMLGCKGLLKPAQDWVHIADRIGVYNMANTRTLTNSDATPDITGYNFIKVSNGSNTSITNFTGGHYQQFITLLFTNNYTTLVNGNLLLKNSTNVTPQANNSIQLMNIGNNTWLEIGRNF